MKVRFIHLAQGELDDAVAWYAQESPGLEMQFLDEIDRAVRRVIAFP
jgi:hypothetical protein